MNQNRSKSFELPKELSAAVARPNLLRVYVSDIDKTYLSTQIDTLSGLLRAAFETAERKSNVPGFSTLLRALRRGALEAPAEHPLLFVSASPPQLRAKIESKMDIDGVRHDGIVFKNQLEHVRRAAFRKLKEHLSFKLEALVMVWLSFGGKVPLVLFGDDSESDPDVFSLFYEIASGRLAGENLNTVLNWFQVGQREQRTLQECVSQVIPTENPLAGAFVNVVTDAQLSYYDRYGSYFCATENTLQAALVAWEKSWIRDVAVRTIAKDLVFGHDVFPRDLGKVVLSGVQRQLYSISTAMHFWPQLLAERCVHPENIPLSEAQVLDLKALPARVASERLEKPSLAYYRRLYASTELRY